jgi:hypothetical protein
MLEGDSAQRLSHHYHQCTDEIKAVHLLFRLTIQSSNNEVIYQS